MKANLFARNAALPAALALSLAAGNCLAAALPGGTQNPTRIPKYVSPLTIPGTMPHQDRGTHDYYEIEVVQFAQQILPKPFKPTTVWSYAAVGDASTRQYPAHTVEATVDRPVQVKWVNNLKDPATGNFLPHLLPVDPTLHWANPPQTCRDEMSGQTFTGTDCAGSSQARYTGPVPIVPHLHGAHVGPASDGYPSAWFLPAANDIPAGYATEGKEYSDIFGGSGRGKGYAVYEYPNDQQATTLWYHDHALGMTRLNVYAGPTGFYLLRGGAGDITDDTRSRRIAGDGKLPAGAHEIPLVIQDRSFNKDGSLFYPDNRAFFEGLGADQLKIPFTPDTTLAGEISDVAPMWNPEFFGNTMVVNGQTWPYLEVEPRQYRFRLLNGSDSRFLILTSADGALAFHQIGADGGFLPKPETQSELLIAPAERADVIVDFSALAGRTVTLINLGPDEPYGGGVPGVDFDPADPGTTGQVMQFRVAASASSPDASTPVAHLGLPAPARLGKAGVTRQISLNEADSETVLIPVDGLGEYMLDKKGNLVEVDQDNPYAVPFGPSEAMLGIVDALGEPVPMEFMEPISENPQLGATEVWEIYNFTADAHPIHIHQVQFEVVNRQALVTDNEGMAAIPAKLLGKPRPAEAWETGRKDTLIVYPGEMARVKARFDIEGLFVWHCHILSHEDNEMMRPFYVGQMPVGM